MNSQLERLVTEWPRWLSCGLTGVAKRAINGIIFFIPFKSMGCKVGAHFYQCVCVLLTVSYDSFSTVGNCKSACLASVGVEEVGKFLLKLVLTILLKSASRM